MTYTSEDLGREVEAPSGYYLPLKELVLEYSGRNLLCVLGSACVEASCCGVGSWQYVRVEGYVVADSRSSDEVDRLEVDTIEHSGEKAEISRFVREKHPEARIEFR